MKNRILRITAAVVAICFFSTQVLAQAPAAPANMQAQLNSLNGQVTHLIQGLGANTQMAKEWQTFKAKCGLEASDMLGKACARQAKRVITVARKSFNETELGQLKKLFDDYFLLRFQQTMSALLDKKLQPLKNGQQQILLGLDEIKKLLAMPRARGCGDILALFGAGGLKVNAQVPQEMLVALLQANKDCQTKNHETAVAVLKYGGEFTQLGGYYHVTSGEAAESYLAELLGGSAAAAGVAIGLGVYLGSERGRLVNHWTEEEILADGVIRRVTPDMTMTDLGVTLGTIGASAALGALVWFIVEQFEDD